MKVHVYEKAFLWLGAVLLVVCMGALVYATLAMGIHLPGRSGEIAPSDVRSTPPFTELGPREIGPNEMEVVFIGRMWDFEPSEVRIPAGTTVTFTGTTVDVIHGFHVDGTRLNMMLIPGQISRNTYTFDDPGEHLVICHEYCGPGHHVMYGTIIVE